MGIGLKTVRETADKVSAIASDTRSAILGLGVLAVLALGVAILALAVSARKGHVHA